MSQPELFGDFMAGIESARAELESTRDLDLPRRAQCRTLKQAAEVAQHRLCSGVDSALALGDLTDKVKALVSLVTEAGTPEYVRRGNDVAFALERAGVTLLMAAFFTTGRMYGREEGAGGGAIGEALALLSDSEWLSACIEFVKAVSDSYAVSRATSNDVASVELCRDLAQQVRVVVWGDVGTRSVCYL